jgi:hypothetical protein
LTGERVNIRYESLTYKQDEIWQFLNIAKFSLRMKFGHVVSDRGTLRLVKSSFNSEKWVLLIERVTLAKYRVLS